MAWTKAFPKRAEAVGRGGDRGTEAPELSFKAVDFFVSFYLYFVLFNNIAGSAQFYDLGDGTGVDQGLREREGRGGGYNSRG